MTDRAELEAQLARLTARCAELEEQSSEARFAEVLLRSILDTVPDFVVKMSPDGIIHFCNRIAPGLGVTDVAGESIYSFMQPEYHEVARRAIERVLETRKPDSYETVGAGPYGSWAKYLTRIAPIERAGEVESLVLVATDVTDLMDTQSRLSESRQKLELAIKASGVGLWVWNRDGDKVEWDAAACATFGVERAPASIAEFLVLVHPEDRERVEDNAMRALEHGHFEDIEHRVIRPSGELRWLMSKGRVEHDASGRAVRLRGGVLDVTERHQLQEQLVQAQKMEAVGQLAAGIAHNFNNMLTVMLSSMELAARKSGGESAGVLRDGQQSALRAAQMVRQLMVFSGGSRGSARRPEDIGALVERTVNMARTTFGTHYSIVVTLASRLPPVRCDSGQIEQALLNVLINARDAFDGVEGRGAEIRVGADLTGSEIRLSVADNGCGMSEEVRRRVFEPFFTTKEPGRGTGLGLATTYAIVREHGGRVDCCSNEGVGTRIEIHLPAEVQASPANDAGLREVPRSGRGERVLVVDDEPLIRDLIARVLGDAGYLVDTAVDGIDAIERVRANVGRYRVILLDQSMPRLAGRAALRAMRGLSSDLKIICFSGYPSSLDGADAVLEKPVPEQRLLETLDRVLGRG